MPQKTRRGDPRERRHADGSIYYEARAMINGRRVSFYDGTKTGARTQADEARVDARRGGVTADAGITMATYLEAWLASVKRNVRGRTYMAYASHVRIHIIPALGRIKLIDLAPGHVRAMLANLLHDKDLSETTVRHIRATLSGALKQAMIDYGLPRNVASLAKIPKGNKPDFKPEVISPQQARAIVAAFRGSRIEPLVIFAATTGLRQSELLALRWEDLDLPARTMRVRHALDVKDGERVFARPKSKKGQREMRLPDLALRALEMRRRQMEKDRLLAGSAWQGGDVVFANPTGGLRNGSTLTASFKGYLRRRGIAPIRWHALRRVFAAVLQDQGVSLAHIRDLMGHSQMRVTESYAYTMLESRKSAMDAIDTGLAPGAAESELGYEWGRTPLQRPTPAQSASAN